MVLEWPGQVAASHGIDWNYLYWYQLMGGSQDFLEAKLQRANDLGAIPVITHYQLLDRGRDARFVTWIETISQGTGLSYLHWQTVIGASDYGLMPDYPTHERITPLVGAGSVGCLLDLFSLDGPPHSQPQHGFTSSPAATHPAYNSLDKLAERLGAYYGSPIALAP